MNAINFTIEPADIEYCFEVTDYIEQGQAALNKKSKEQKKKFQGKDRDGDNVTGIVLHQMGFQRGPMIRKYFSVCAHYIITTDGKIAQLHLHNESLYSSNYLNSFTVAVEIAGNLRNDRGRWWLGGATKDTLHAEQVTAGRFLLGHLKTLYGINKVYAHRQGTGLRRANCCGPEIWTNIAEYAIHDLGYEDTRDETYGPGSTIPESWRTVEVKEEA